MRILVIHQNFPGQFGHLVKAWAQRPGWDVRALAATPHQACRGSTA